VNIEIYNTTRFLVVLYGCQSWFVKLREEHRLPVFVKRVLRSIFGSRREELAGDWRRIHNKELHTLYASLNTVSMTKSPRVVTGE
jgi:hypothetical protein